MAEDEVKMLPGGTGAGVATQATAVGMPARQLQDLPKDELENLAEDLGLDPTCFKSRQHLVAGIHERRQMIATMDREAMLDIVKWGRRPVPVNVSNEYLAQEISRIRSMRFSGLSQRGLITLAMLRGVRVGPNDDVPGLIKRLKKQEGWFSRINRKRRAMLGSVVSSMIGDNEDQTDYQFLPPQQGSGPATGSTAAPSTASRRSGTIKEEIEDAGLFGGIAGRIKKSADSYLNQKLDEIETRIDRKLDEIDRRLAEWRDKEIANRIRILKITLWASVIVSLISLLYFYVRVSFLG